MVNSRELAQIIGPTLCVMTLSEMMNLSIWESSIPSVTFLNGVLLFVGGISIIRVHNLWVRNWIVLITVIGWLILIIGSIRMLFPTAKQAGDNISTYLLLTGLFVTGLFVSFKGYYRNKNSSDKS
jgi:protein-S-isoprenylcysteine O-methyltransferase Ste14